MSLPIKKVGKIKIEEKVIYKNLRKYNKTQEKIYQNKIKNLMFHKKSHFTAIFTEYLIWDDKQEFLFELYSKKYSLPNLSSYTKIQYNKFFIPIIINEWGRNLIKLNTKMKKLLISQFTDKSKQIDPSKYILKKYSKILPSDLSDNTLDDKEDLIDNSFKTFKNFNINQINNKNNNNINNNIVDNNIPLKGKEISESESTIDNVNANNDISISLDLKMNQKYDDKILTQNVGFVIGKNGKNDEDLLRMMKYLKPINTAYIYQNNKYKLRSNYIYLDYVNNKTSRLTETTKKSSKNKSENKKKTLNNINNNEQFKTFTNLNNSNKNIINKNINCQKNNSKNTSINKNKKPTEQKSNNNNKKNYKLYSKSNNKTNNSKNNNNSNKNNNYNNNNIINGYNDLNNKTTSTKTNSYNTTYKNKSENRKPAISSNRNKKENDFITQHNSELKVTTPFLNENKNFENSEKEIVNIRYGSLKFGKTNKNSEENSKIQTIIIPQKVLSNIKEKNFDILKTANNISNVNNINIYGEIKNYKRNNNKILDISSDKKKMKFFISSKEENNNINKFSGKKIVKKEKSLDNKPLNTGIYKPIVSQISNKKNVIIVKRKISDGINTFYKI